jgi:hypothetical protein
MGMDETTDKQGLLDKAKDKAGDLKDKAADMAGGLKDKASDMMGGAKDKARDAGDDEDRTMR